MHDIPTGPSGHHHSHGDHAHPHAHGHGKHEHGHTHHHPHVHTADGDEVPAGEPIEPGDLWQAPEGQSQNILWIDATEGASGDMLLAALIDAGADARSVARVLQIIAPGKLHLQQRRVQRGAFSALKIDVIADEPNPPARHLSDIKAMLDHEDVPGFTRELAVEAFTRLAVAEAKVHGASVESVHFHEVGALDSIGDIVGVCEAIRTLRVGEATSSKVAVGAGTIQTMHGTLTVPPPAVVELSRGWEIEAGGPQDVGELCTPTGMTLIRAICSKVGSMPAMKLDTVGFGAGSRVRQDRAGILRAVVGSPASPDTGATQPTEPQFTGSDTVVQVDANVDDLDPRVWPAVIDQLMEAGALDAWLTPVIMKKGRPAHVCSALAKADSVNAVIDALLNHTSTIGARVSAPAHRRVLKREWQTVQVEGHPVRIKISANREQTQILQATAEFVDVEKLAEVLAVPQRVALARAQCAAAESGLYSGANWPGHGGEGERP
ncbi:MAG: nickel pincer cofactor biosynthesis protein LarC [Actinomycetaceae bacterium]|nr:nickel pincer cofactor biosynthesis protein LarC [Actinomycetaceae bacterium]